MKEEIKNALLKLKEIPLDEADVILSLMGGEHGGLTAGDHALTSSDQVVTILGYSSTLKNPETLFPADKDVSEMNRALKSLEISPELTDPKQMAVALFYDD